MLITLLSEVADVLLLSGRISHQLDPSSDMRNIMQISPQKCNSLQLFVDCLVIDDHFTITFYVSKSNVPDFIDPALEQVHIHDYINSIPIKNNVLKTAKTGKANIGYVVPCNLHSVPKKLTVQMFYNLNLPDKCTYSLGLKSDWLAIKVGIDIYRQCLLQRKCIILQATRRKLTKGNFKETEPSQNIMEQILTMKN